MEIRGNYILVDGKPVEEPDIHKWGKFFQDGDKRKLLRTDVPGGYVSTVFLGIDHSFGDGAKPVLWETLVFGGKHDGEMERYTREEHAINGHYEMVERCMASPEETKE